MRRMAVGLAAALTLGFAGSAFGESDFDEIQDEEQPGSEIGIQIGDGMSRRNARTARRSSPLRLTQHPLQSFLPRPT